MSTYYTHKSYFTFWKNWNTKQLPISCEFFKQYWQKVDEKKTLTKYCSRISHEVTK